MIAREVGNRDYPIWLLGDSNPKQWQDRLLTPLDPRHPIRHNIWTSILDVMQDRVFREYRARVDTSQPYIRNAVDNSAGKPKPTDVEWGKVANREVVHLRALIDSHKPRLLLCFGAFAFEFAKHALDQAPHHSYRYWGAKRLGEEFRQAIDRFGPDATNVIPLLHRSISGGKFVQSHEYFCDKKGTNYFEYVGCSIADKLIQHRGQLRIWIE